MMTYHIKHGGTLQVGDFIAISKKDYVQFGWYSGNGRAGNLQFVRPFFVVKDKEHFEDRVRKGTTSNKDKQGFSLDHIGKEFVKHKHADYVIKINDASGLFTGVDLQLYEEARSILKAMNVIKI